MRLGNACSSHSIFCTPLDFAQSMGLRDVHALCSIVLYEVVARTTAKQASKCGVGMTEGRISSPRIHTLRHNNR
ncbi:hypothetical protein WOLCODRAFT_22832 [Wolfiporia cocos MD-104 SS10]|uniref:Uncharacterized protein n=1 Tax=Wolfiporia cocos (strain MD-104) TaxID=742152 RepID=A0A2H3JM84_WOLCO|nr:hypothetical protein WOLCODRAFT_22832 [Wolfiporia cocos MD-104 SS10]